MIFKIVSSVADHADGGADAAVSASADSVLLLAAAASCCGCHALSVAVRVAAGLSDALSHVVLIPLILMSP